MAAITHESFGSPGLRNLWGNAYSHPEESQRVVLHIVVGLSGCSFNCEGTPDEMLSLAGALTKAANTAKKAEAVTA